MNIKKQLLLIMLIFSIKLFSMDISTLANLNERKEGPLDFAEFEVMPIDLQNIIVDYLDEWVFEKNISNLESELFDNNILVGEDKLEIDNANAENITNGHKLTSFTFTVPNFNEEEINKVLNNESQLIKILNFLKRKIGRHLVGPIDMNYEQYNDISQRINEYKNIEEKKLKETGFYDFLKQHQKNMEIECIAFLNSNLIAFGTYEYIYIYDLKTATPITRLNVTGDGVERIIKLSDYRFVTEEACIKNSNWWLSFKDLLYAKVWKNQAIELKKSNQKKFEIIKKRSKKKQNLCEKINKKSIEALCFLRNKGA